MKAVERLVHSGRPLNAADKSGLFPLIIAVYKDNMPLVKYLLAHGADVNFHPFYGPAIVVSQTEEMALFLLKQGTDIDCRPKSEGGPTVSNILFFMAAGRGWMNLLAQVHIKVKDVNIRDYYGHTPLAGAARNGQVEALRMLLKWGATVDSADSNGITPLMEACCAGQVSTASELIAAGADVNRTDKGGISVLALAVFRCWSPAPPADYGPRDKRPILRLLLEAGAKLDKSVVVKLEHTPCKDAYEMLSQVSASQ